MVAPPQFSLLEEMESSIWLQQIRDQFVQDQFPLECARCQQTESINGTSIRLNSIQFDQQQTRSDYLTVGGVLDNVCNSACQTCNANLSTKIGSLAGSNYIKIDNATRFWQLPLDRVVHLDINGGEPSASKNYRYLLANCPPNVKSVRVNTNCSKVLTELDALVARGVQVTVTASLDGIDRIHDYVRWPIKFVDFERNLLTYQNMGVDLNTWTTVSALNIGDLKNIFDYVHSHKLKHSWALLETPAVIHVKHSNKLTQSADVPQELQHIVASHPDNTNELIAWIAAQDQLRKINIQDYYDTF